MSDYLALVDHQDGGAYGVRFPDLPNVFSGADDAGDIVANAVEALQSWAEDMPMPEPSTEAALMARDDVRQELETGCYLLAVPFTEAARRPAARHGDRRRT